MSPIFRWQVLALIKGETGIVLELETADDRFVTYKICEPLEDECFLSVILVT